MHWRLVPPVVALASMVTRFAAGQDEQNPPDATPPQAQDPSEAPTAPDAVGESGADDGAPPTPDTSVEGTAADTSVEGEAAPAENKQPSAPEPQPTPPEGSHQEEYEEPEVPMTPPAPDSLGGHFVLGAGASYVYPTGRLGSSLSHRGQIGDGLGIVADLGLGVTRQTVLGAWGQLGLLSEGSRCSDCTGGMSFGVGPFVRYHLVQGLRFDPWLSFGIGYRKLSVESGTASTDYAGVEWARLQIGGDWYPAANFGFGPYLGFSSGGYTSRPPEAGDLRAYYELSAGLRIVLDVPGKPR